MKILIATGIYPPDIGGPATYTVSLAKELTKLGHKVTVITYTDDKRANARGAWRLVTVNRRWPLLLRYRLYQIKVWWYGFQNDCIYAQDSVSAGLPAMVANWFLWKPFVLKVVGDYAWEQGQNKYGVRDDLNAFQHKKYSWKIEMLRWIEKKVARHATKIITPSKYLKGIVEQWEIPSEKISVVYNSYDAAAIVVAKQPDKTEEIIMSVGRLVPWKGLDTLIELMPQILKVRPNAKLVIAGDGPFKKQLEETIAANHLEGKVILRGRLAHEQLLEELSRASVFVLNSSYEGLSHQILEAQALKIPCAVSSVGGNPEVIENEKTGLLFEYNKETIKDSILKLLDNPDYAKSLANEAYRNLEKFNFEKMIKETVKVLESVCQKS